MRLIYLEVYYPISNVSGEECLSCEKKTVSKSSALAESIKSIVIDDKAAAYHDTPELPAAVTCILWGF
jgi:hypothetical protein